MKKFVKYKFTLAELLVSMAVFSILLVLMMQFFSGAKTLWTANEKRSAIYADATIAMDLMSTLLQSTFYGGEGPLPFAIRNVPASSSAAVPRVPDEKAIKDVTEIDGWNSKIYFISNSPLELSAGSSVRYLGVRRTSDSNTADIKNNVLEILVFSDSSAANLKFHQCFVPFGTNVSPNNTVTEARSWLLNDVFDKEPSPLTSQERKVVLRNVTGLKFTPVDHRGQKIYGADCNDLPAGIEIELFLMADEQTIRDFQALAKEDPDRKDFRLKHEYSFRRTVWLGARGGHI